MAKKPGIVYHKPTIRSWRDEGHFVVPGVIYRGETGTYGIFEQMTAPLNLKQLAELYEREKPRENPHPMDSVLHFATPLAAHRLREESPQEAERLRAFLRQGFRQYPNTLTRVDYSPSGKDRVVHNCGTSDEYVLNGRVVGENNWMKDIPDKSVLELLLGTSDVNQIDEVFQWINRTDGFVWRLNSKLNKREKRVAGFNAYDNGLDLRCNGNPLGEYPAFRVLRIE